MAELQELKATLLRGVRLSKQTSYERRAPAKAAVPFLRQARDGLRDYVAANANDREGWQLLSQAEETLLDYQAARVALEKAMQLTAKRDKRDLKRLAMLRELTEEWAGLVLSPSQLQELGRYLEEELKGSTGDRSLRLTRQWLERQGLNLERIVRALEDRGAYSDFQVLYNVVRG